MKNPKVYYRIDGQGNPIPGTLARLSKKPITGLWRELTNICCETATVCNTACEEAGVTPHTNVIMTDDGGNIHLEFTGGNELADVQFYIHIFKPSPFIAGNVTNVFTLAAGVTELTTSVATTVDFCDSVEIYFKATCETLWHHVTVKEGGHC